MTYLILLLAMLFGNSPAPTVINIPADTPRGSRTARGGITTPPPPVVTNIPADTPRGSRTSRLGIVGQ
jgi:hypothetical protein